MLIAVMMVRDEADIVGWTVRNLFDQGVDRLIVADNLSIDATTEILAELANQHDIDLLVDDEVGYYQADKMTDLANRAIAQGAEWVLPCDADELWLPMARPTIKAALDACDAGVVLAEEYRYWPHAPTSNPNPYRAIRWREESAHRLRKVAFRAEGFERLHMGNHDVDHSGKRVGGVLHMCHFPYRTFSQFLTKVRNGREAYQAAKDMHPGYGTHWREMGALDHDDLYDLWRDATTADEVVSDWLAHGPLTQDPIW